MKHALLIVAHKQFEILIKMLKTLDHEDIDFFIHIDKKCQKYPKHEIEQACSYSNVHFIKRQNVHWGGYSQIRCTLSLLSNAISNNYDYYHLLSGQDFPIKKKQQFLEFFNQNAGIEYVHFMEKEIEDRHLDRIRYHWFSMDGAKKWEKITEIEKRIGYNRFENNEIQTFYMGSNWFSITHEFAQYLLSKEKWIHKTFRHSALGDELFVQTLLMNGPFQNRLSENNFIYDSTSCMRKIHFNEQGKPYVFQTKDFNDLIQSPCLFARKFDLDIDSEIIDRLFEYLKNSK